MDFSALRERIVKRFGLDRLSSTRIIIFGYLAIILLGTLLLCLPVSAQSRTWTDPLGALFTATSATCVTGLVVYNTAAHWSLFGQLVILALIQVGGMGFLTMAVLVSVAARRRIGLRQRFTMQESIAAPTLGGIVRLTSFIFKGVLLFEGAGALLLSLRFIPLFGGPKGLYYAVFHSISAFCNAGFDLLGTFEGAGSLTYFVDDPLVNLTCAALILIGGLGFFVWEDLYHKRLQWKRYLLHTKLVLVALVGLVAVPTVLLWVFERDNAAFAGLSGAGKLLAAFFQSCTARTAGFNTVDLSMLSQAGKMIMILLMLIGGNSGSTAGGMKTTTVSVLFLTVVSTIRRDNEIAAFGRRIDEKALRDAVTIVTSYITLAVGGAVFISAFEHVPMINALFETSSAVATVGLTLGLTPTLSTLSRLLIICLMYFGRVGFLTMIYALGDAGPSKAALSLNPLENIAVG